MTHQQTVVRFRAATPSETVSVSTEPANAEPEH